VRVGSKDGVIGDGRIANPRLGGPRKSVQDCDAASADLWAMWPCTSVTNPNWGRGKTVVRTQKDCRKSCTQRCSDRSCKCSNRRFRLSLFLFLSTFLDLRPVSAANDLQPVGDSNIQVKYAHLSGPTGRPIASESIRNYIKILK
jgi:hypothetical protein